MKTKLIPRITLMCLLVSAAAASGTVLADQKGQDAHIVKNGQKFSNSSLEPACWRHHHHYRHCHRR
jgi:hypothetical protein